MRCTASYPVSPSARMEKNFGVLTPMSLGIIIICSGDQCIFMAMVMVVVYLADLAGDLRICRPN